MEYEVITGDCLESLRGFPDECIDCCVTSPPYFRLRDYGIEGQIGQEKEVEGYISRVTAVFLEVLRVIKPSGTLWLNLGDSYGKNKQLLGIPWRVAFSLQASGWILRQDIIWQKPNPLPESVKDRCTKSHEYIFLFSKSEKYFFDFEKIQEPAVCGAKGSQFHTGKTGEHQLGRAQKVRTSVKEGGFEAKGEPLPGQLPFRAIVDMRRKRSVWNISLCPYPGAHFAVYPKELARTCIQAGCPEGGVVLDPFCGSGTTGVEAKHANAHFVGIELNPEYANLARARIEGGK